MAGAQVSSLFAAGRPAITVSLFSGTTSNAATIAWPGSLLAGDVAVLSDGAATAFAPQTAVLPSGFTQIISTPSVSAFEPRVMESYKILTGSESGSITGMNGSFMGKILRIFRGSVAITSVSPSAWNSQATTGDPSSQVVSPGGAPSIIIATALGSDRSPSFSVASPAFDATASPSGTLIIGGYKIYNSSPTSHTIDMPDNNYNVLVSGYLAIA